MARKLRIEFPDAVYHVLNRGNYRRDLFTNAGEAGAFVKVLEEAADIYGWRANPTGSGRALLQDLDITPPI